MSIDQGRPSTPALFADALSQMSSLFETEIRLVRTEITEKLSIAIKTVVVMLAAAVMLLLGLLLLLFGVVYGIAALGPPIWVVFFIVGIVIIAVGGIALLLGLTELSGDNLLPKRSIDQIGKDATIVREQVQ